MHKLMIHDISAYIGLDSSKKKKTQPSLFSFKKITFV